MQSVEQTSFALSMSAGSAGKFSERLFCVLPDNTKLVYYTYILQSKTTGQFYVGVSSDIMQTMKSHQSDCERATRGRGPWWLPYYEIYETHDEAQARSDEIKSKKSSRYIRTIIYDAYPTIELY